MSSHISTPVFRIEVTSSLTNRADIIVTQLPAIGVTGKIPIKVVDLYFLKGNFPEEALREVSQSLLCDPVTDKYTWKQVENGRVSKFNGRNSSESLIIEVMLQPGVTDNVANELKQTAQRIGLNQLEAVATGTSYHFSGEFSEEMGHKIAKSLLVNGTIQHYYLGEIQPEFIQTSPKIHPLEQIELSKLDDNGLLSLSERRRLALDLNEMRVIQDYFRTENRPATDAELETIAQTWSEHCTHKTFKARINVQDGKDTYSVDNMLKTYLQAATDTINAPWVRSAFVDNAGVIEFDDEFDLSFKVETHNHPSAIEPFGGANTGIGGVVRDILGVSHRPIAATDVLCFGPADLPHASVPEGTLHPARIRAGVVKGIEDYGNKLGLPTVNGSVTYHEGYISNPLVYCGAIGIGPRDSHPREPQPQDRVIVLGGRTGRDGLRGATFSSLTMDAQTGEVAGASVQIGDPITEKGLLEVITRARDAKLYNAITDCGAGGLSSAVGEMAANLGVRVELSKVMLKYSGLAPWEIWLSEAQERMVLAVPPENLSALIEICETYWVEWSDIGEFESTKRLDVRLADIHVIDLENGFLHACPRRELNAEVPAKNPTQVAKNQASDLSLSELLLKLLSHPNIASKESIIRVYDHEVRGSTIVKPLVGPYADGPSDACVLKPLETAGWKGFVVANGMNPILGQADAYAMAISAVDEAVRNAVAVGADPERIAILDNFCWGDPLRPETLGTLVQAAQGCHDAAVHFKTPFISGKDSLNNEYLGSDGKQRAIPGSLLISCIAIHQDVRNSVTMDLKESGNHIYLVGEWIPALAGCHALYVGGAALFENSHSLHVSPSLPELAPQVYAALNKVIHKGLVRAAHDLSEGGLVVAAAEMALAGRLGLAIDISALAETPAVALFAETNGCLLVEVPPENEREFESHFKNLPLEKIGMVTNQNTFIINNAQSVLLNLELSELISSFKIFVSTS